MIQLKNSSEEEKKKILKKVYELGFDYEANRGGCAQSVIAAIQDVFDLADDDIFKSAQCFAAGGALSGCGTCGALNGGMMMISHCLGRDRKLFSKGESKREPLIIAKSLFDRFVNKYGTCICGDVQKKIMGKSYNLWYEMDEFLKNGGHKDKCPKVVGITAMWTAEILLDKLR